MIKGNDRRLSSDLDGKSSYWWSINLYSDIRKITGSWSFVSVSIGSSIYLVDDVEQERDSYSPPITDMQLFPCRYSLQRPMVPSSFVRTKASKEPCYAFRDMTWQAWEKTITFIPMETPNKAAMLTLGLLRCGNRNLWKFQWFISCILESLHCKLTAQLIFIKSELVYISAGLLGARDCISSETLERCVARIESNFQDTKKKFRAFRNPSNHIYLPHQPPHSWPDKNLPHSPPPL